MLMNIIKFVHLLLTVSFLGLQIANYYYVVTSQRSHSIPLLYYTLQLTLLIDAALLAVLISMYLTCAYLVLHLADISFATTWIQTACFLLTVVAICFISNMLIKWKNLNAIQGKNLAAFKYKKIMHVNFTLIITLLIIIVHDAVMQTT